ncbi:hypothetical protein BKI52_15300 [marine bacterium AO1-C]|nr:hypothetical protein BKI52_15300 [marine bacterium AO1-C]
MKKIFLTSFFALITFVFAQAQTGNTTLGSQAGVRISTGDYNTMVGYGAGNRTTTGSNNLFLGKEAGVFNTSGNANVFIGRNTGIKNTSGSSNMYMGQSAGYSNQTGSNNICIGVNAGFYETGSNKLYIANSRNNPLIYGEFDNKILKINGTMAIGTDNYNGSGYGLYVADGIRTEAVQIDAETNWPDYVFANDYKLNPLNEVEAFIQKNSHLPNVPSAKEVNDKGINVVEMDATLLRKIEELTLYTIGQQKHIDKLTKHNQDQKDRIDHLQKEVNELKALIKAHIKK